MVIVSTAGSTLDTVIAVYGKVGTNTVRTQLACNDNEPGTTNKYSVLSVPVQGGKTNFIVVDGKKGATGTLKLSYSLLTVAHLSPMGMSNNASRVRVSGRVGMKFSLQRSSNTVNWVSIFTTSNSPTANFDYTDPGTPNNPPRYYRAQLLP